MQRTVLVMSGSLSLYSKYIKIAPKEAVFKTLFQAFLTQPPFVIVFHAVY